MLFPTIIEKRQLERLCATAKKKLSHTGVSCLRNGVLNVVMTFAVLTVLSLPAPMAPAFVFGPSPVMAGEGMWTLNKLDQCPFDKWKAAGLQVDQKEIFNPKGADLADAIVQLGGGTASFVSPNGLLLTNHHVAFGALQRQSSVEINYIEDGFLARTHEDEIPALGYEARVLLDIKDVTEEVMKGVKDKMSDKERYDKTEENTKKIVKKAEEGNDVECTVRGFYGGAEYYLYTYFMIKDIRIVYAPPRSIGVYGGDEDNWMWPRHTGDFSFLRAYVAPDGKTAEFAEGNIPYKPTKFLPFSNQPLAEGDLTMVLGYPGGTRRYRTSYAIDYYVNQMYPQAIARYTDLLAILDDEAANNPEAGIKVASLIQGLNNGLKNNIGMLEGLVKVDLLGKKLAEEKALREFVKSDPDLEKKYGTVIDEIGAQYADYLQYAELNTIAGWMGYAANAMSSAYTVYKWSNEHDKKNDLDRDPGFQDRDEPRTKKRLELADLRYDESSDKRILKYFFKKAMALPEGQQLKSLDPVTAGLTGDARDQAIDDFVESLYAGTKITNKEERMKMFGMAKKDLMALNDPMIEFASKLEAERKELENRSDAFGGAVERLRPQLMELRRAHGGELLYPDANGTMRLSIGKVAGYNPRDAVTYHYQTTLKGVIEKDTGEAPFNCPEALTDLYESKDFGNYADKKTNDVPVCLLTTNDSTGGNSGSPIMNGKGEVIGTLFDGNFEAMASDMFFMPEMTRAIHCDSRYILFIVDKFAGAEELLNELTVHGGGSL
jgi:hypothetical protein